ncbi:MAG: Uma2 family endonuclease [Hormoscilla sp. GM7CHS1pb]|nr:Uma2 family endonuclease [Hormoscilla sp. GM7CHS1pb]
MSEQAVITKTDYWEPDVSNLVTEDDTPVDNFCSEKQQRFLANSVYNSGPWQTFVAAANVGIFYSSEEPAIVPDVFLSLDVTVPEDWWKKQNRCYMVWKFKKPPEVAIEIVSNKKGEELGEKLNIYAKVGVTYYIVYDPSQQLGKKLLRVYELRGMRYYETNQTWLDKVGLGVTLWSGVFEGRHDVWLRWCDREGNVLLTGSEIGEQEKQRAEQEKQRAEQEKQRAEQEKQRAEQEKQRAEQEKQRASLAESQLEQTSDQLEQEKQRTQLLAERLLALGIDPDSL